MQNLLSDLTALLVKDQRLVADGELLKNKIVELALGMDAELIKLLLSNGKIKKHFFKQVGDITIFDNVKFQRFISNKEFLPDSYTAFKNKIGLVDERGDYLIDSRNVVLGWPYKDCVLEGGQTKEDQKRDEIFWNTTLAPDEIDRLLAPKVFTGWKRYDQKGEHLIDGEKKIDFQNENLVIRGNNLLVLHSLVGKYQGKVKMIYIDPPYNREEDKASFYNDKFNHSTWLTFMKNRLQIAKRTLADTGVIFISIDDNEAAYLKVLCDEIFGDENFLAVVSYERSGVSGLGQGGGFLVNTHESIICFARSKSQLRIFDLSGEGDFGYEEMKRYNKILVNVGQMKKVNSFVAPSTGQEVEIFSHDNFEIQTISLRDFDGRKHEILGQYRENFERIFRNTSVQDENEFQTKILNICKDGLYSATYLVSRGKYKGQRTTAYYLNGQVFAWLRESAKLVNGNIVKTNKLSDFWDHASIPKADLANEGGVKLRRGKKPENLIKRLLLIATQPGDLVLDFHSGSGTTCAVAHKMGRQYIGVEQLDYEGNDSLVRLSNVIAGDNTGISKSIKWKGGGEFLYCELMGKNAVFVEKIQKAKKTDALMDIWADMQAKAFISYKVDPKAIDAERALFQELSLADQKKFLLEILDKNHLYVNYDEINDAEYKVSEADKKLNRMFYGEV